jgi:hypothetical protein
MLLAGHPQHSPGCLHSPLPQLPPLQPCHRSGVAACRKPRCTQVHASLADQQSPAAASHQVGALAHMQWMSEVVTRRG